MCLLKALKKVQGPMSFLYLARILHISSIKKDKNMLELVSRFEIGSICFIQQMQSLFLGSPAQMRIAVNKLDSSNVEGLNQGYNGQSRSSIPLDVQYTISKNFLDRITNSLLHKELEAIAKSEDLVNKLQKTKVQDSKDNFACSRSQISTCNSLDDWPKRGGDERRLISRKSPKTLPPDWQLERCIRDIEENCSRKTLSIIRALVQDSKAMKKAIITLQSSNKTNQSIINHYQIVEQETIILKKEITQLHAELTRIKTEYKNVQSEDKRVAAIGNEMFFTEHSNSLKMFLLAKENYISEKEKKATVLMSRIQSAFEYKKQEESCNKCCSFLKKIKESLLGYRKFLQEQQKQVTTLFEECKSILIFE